MYKSYGFTPIAFGNVLKAICELIRTDKLAASLALQTRIPLPPHKIGEMVSRFANISVEGRKDRLLLQTVGTECRKIRNDIWVNEVKQYINPRTRTNFVITDCRRSFELNSFPDAISVFIDCEESVIYNRLKQRDGYYDVDILSREAELEVPLLKEKCDFIVDNNETLKDLAMQIKNIMEVIR